MVDAETKEEDCWFGVTDARKRKQIQDRLAQRARRQRISRRKVIAAESQGEKGNAVGRVCTHDAVLQSLESAGQAPKPTKMSFGIFRGQLPTVGSCGHGMLESFPMAIDQRFTRTSGLSVYAALYDNGAMLGLSCSVSSQGLSRPASPHIPESLRPTALQLSTVHLHWIDRFPFPRMRDNCIRSLGAIDAEDFIGDLFRMESLVIKEGRPGWDPAAWMIGKDFKEKWGYLFA